MLYAGLMALIYPLGTPLLYAGMLYEVPLFRGCSPSVVTSPPKRSS